MKPGIDANPPIAPPPGCDHMVQFYDDAEFLCRTAADFLAQGILAGQPALVIATAANSAAIADYLANQEIDVETLREQGRYASFDADALLPRIMAGSMPDPQLLQAIVGGAIEKILHAGNGHVRIYGEMVNVLWRQGNSAAALHLEKFVNELTATHSCSVLCGYRMEGFHGEAGARGFAQICALHRQVLPAEARPANGPRSS
ncbi:MAG TPA: MEDS domain-containing protein [Burkholderiales bacterium]